MPNEPDSTLPAKPLLVEDLAEAIQSIIRLAQERNSAPGGCSEQPSLAILRVIQNLTPEEWEAFASTHGMDGWVYFSLQNDVKDSVRQLLSAQQRLLYECDHDPLTGIGNRRFLSRTLEAEVERANRSQTELSLVYLDLDGFKEVNDTYGHDCGDVVLVRMAKLLQRSVRHYDLVCRLGGDEFIILLPTSSCWTGDMLANRLLESFRREKFTCGDKCFSLSFSAGVSSLALCEEMSPDALLKSADTAMYEAKNNGRNSVVRARRDKKAKDHSSLVQAQEKLFLFSGSGLE